MTGNYDTTGNILWPYDEEPDSFCDDCGKREYSYKLNKVDHAFVCDKCFEYYHKVQN